MIVRQDFFDLPPKSFMMQVLDNVSKIYVYLWDRKNHDYKVDMTWRETTKTWNKNTFRSCLRKLTNHGLLSYAENEEGLSIELVGWDDLEIE